VSTMRRVLSTLLRLSRQADPVALDALRRALPDLEVPILDAELGRLRRAGVVLLDERSVRLVRETA
jgi:hypothetical protein